MLFLPLLLTLALAVDYYAVLGVDRDATDRELKKAYRSLSRQFHPDKNRGDEGAQQKFIEVSEAYEILSDPEQRRVFDQYGSEGLKNGGGFGGMHHDPMDLFRMSFGNMFQRTNAVRQGPSTVTTLPVTLKDIYQQKTQECQIELTGICDECDGSGSSDSQRPRCERCGGNGQQIIRRQLAPGMIQTIQTTCDACGGKGTVIKHKCGVCHGERVIPENRIFNVFLEPGKPRQYDYVLEGEGDQNPDWIPGNLIVRITEDPEGNLGYRRRGTDLFREEVLSARQAVEGGWSRKITRLDESSTLVLSRAAGDRVYNDMVERIPGEGLPVDADSHGDLYIRYKVVGVYAISHDSSHEPGHGEL